MIKKQRIEERYLVIDISYDISLLMISRKSCDARFVKCSIMLTEEHEVTASERTTKTHWIRQRFATPECLNFSFREKRLIYFRSRELIGEKKSYSEINIETQINKIMVSDFHLTLYNIFAILWFTVYHFHASRKYMLFFQAQNHHTTLIDIYIQHFTLLIPMCNAI